MPPGYVYAKIETIILRKTSVMSISILALGITVDAGHTTIGIASDSTDYISFPSF
jgi:hypothetical protein